MCRSPKIPPPPPPPAEVKQPETATLTDKAKRARSGGFAGNTLLTGASGVTGASTGKATLLGQ